MSLLQKNAYRQNFPWTNSGQLGRNAMTLLGSRRLAEFNGQFAIQDS